MTKKKIRYSEFGQPPETVAAPGMPAAAELPIVADTARTESPSLVEVATAPVEVATAAAPVEVAKTPVGEATTHVDAMPAPRPRRNSTPVELARALAASQARETPAAPMRAIAPAGEDDLPPELENDPAETPLADVLVFRVGAERFAVDLLAVEEVIDLPIIHHVPEMPPAMVGVVTVRGSLTAVYSPHQSLGLPMGLSAAVLIFQRSAGRVGVLIDDVEDAIALDLRALRRAPDVYGDTALVLGVIRHEGSLLAIVDADALIAACQTAALLETA